MLSVTNICLLFTPEIAPGQRCHLDTTDDNPCVDGAVCHNGVCACVNGQASNGNCTVSHAGLA